MPKKAVRHPDRQVTTGAYSDAIAAGPWVFLSGSGPINLRTKEIVGRTIEEQTAVTLDNLKAVLGAAGLGMEHVVKCTAYLSRMEEYDRYNAVFEKFFSEPRPARTTVQAELWGGILVEIDAIAYRD